MYCSVCTLYHVTYRFLQPFMNQFVSVWIYHQLFFWELVWHFWFCFMYCYLLSLPCLFVSFSTTPDNIEYWSIYLIDFLFVYRIGNIICQSLVIVCSFHIFWGRFSSNYFFYQRTFYSDAWKTIRRFSDSENFRGLWTQVTSLIATHMHTKFLTISRSIYVFYVWRGILLNSIERKFKEEIFSR